jgi:hypothetical protein
MELAVIIYLGLGLYFIYALWPIIRYLLLVGLVLGLIAMTFWLLNLFMPAWLAGAIVLVIIACLW